MADRHKSLPLNMKPRQLLCEYCGYEEFSDRPNAKCPTCIQPMITVLQPNKMAILTSLDDEIQKD